jgi:prepilin-type N-terminal cleavage/methylation domain-containing protein
MRSRGFTLIEIMVAVAIFSVVMLIAAGSLLTILNANRKAQALQAAMTNLNFAVDSMVREIRVGSTYRCETGNPLNPINLTQIASPKNCTSPGGQLFAFEKWNGNRSDAGDQIIYRYNPTTKGLERSTDSGQTAFTPMTGSDVQLEEVTFYVRGSQPGFGAGNGQPFVLITIRGTAGTSSTQTSFSLQVAASQRVLDL